MPTSPSALFRHSLLAAAILSATGCASTSPQSSDEGGIGTSLANAGRATADMTGRAWHRTGYLLGLHDDAGTQQQQHPMDEVDLALLEEDAVMAGSRPGDAVTVELAAAGVERAIANPATLRDRSADAIGTSDAELIALNETSPVEELAVGRFVASAENPEPVATVEVVNASVALDDYTHVVGESETLWDIAKATTGDATNWHVLADVNNLAPNAAVYPGQGLTIPADMVKPELAMTDVAPAAVVIAEVAPAQRLNVPVEQDLAESNDGLDLTPVAAAVSPVAPAAMNPSDDARGFRVERGESLWNFAKRTTGDATDWQEIAAHNGFDEQRAGAVREGEEIFVPDMLVRPELDQANANTTVVAASEMSAVEKPAARRMVPIAEASDALPAEAAVPVATVADAAAVDDATSSQSENITIVEAAYRANEASSADTDAVSQITISGTYYPKAIYHDADFSSSLVTRVSPGTSLNVASVDGPWYAVETDDGIGYVHERDIK